MLGKRRISQKKRNNIAFVLLVLILTGIVFSTACTAMVDSGKLNLNDFYDVGNVYDVNEGIANSIGTGINKEPSGQYLEIIEPIGRKDFSLNQMQYNWKYILMSLSDMNVKCLYVDFSYYNNNGELVLRQQRELTEGKNLIELDDNVIYSNLVLRFFNQEGATFSVDKMQFRETIQTMTWSRLLLCWSLSFVLFCGSVWLVSRVWGKRIKKIRWEIPMEALQRLFLKIGNHVKIMEPIKDDKKKGIFRSGLFFGMFLYMQIIYNLGLYDNKHYYPFHMLICSIILILIAFLCKEEKLRILNWKNRLAGAWMVLWFFAILSDFLVNKRYGYLGYQMIFVVGFLFFMWGNMRDRDQLMHDFIRGIEWIYLLNVVFCYLFRPVTEGVRYLGGSFNPGVFAIFLLFAWIALLGKLERYRKTGRKTISVYWTISELAIAANLLWKTQSTSEIGIVVVVTVIYALYNIAEREGHHQKRSLMLANIVLFLFVYWISSVGITYLPRMIDKEIRFEKDLYVQGETNEVFVVQVQAAALKDSRLYQKITSTSFESFTSGRNLYWIGYLREMNLFGHENKAYLWGANRLPHNGMLAIMYRYGVFSGVPYLIMMLYNIMYSLKGCRNADSRKSKYACYNLLVAVGGGLLLIVENTEFPFVWISWLSVYLVMGYNFCQRKQLKSDMDIPS